MESQSIHHVSLCRNFVDPKTSSVNRQFSVCFSCVSSVTDFSCFVRKMRYKWIYKRQIVFTPYIQTIAIHSCIINVIAIFHIERRNNKNNKIVEMIAQNGSVTIIQTQTTHCIVLHKYIPSNSLIAIITYSQFFLSNDNSTIRRHRCFFGRLQRRRRSKPPPSPV
jgi:hypothetical protein